MERTLEQLNKDFEDHNHNNFGTKNLSGRAIKGAPQAGLTAESGGTADATYGATEAALINNHTTRINEIEQVLINLGLLQE